MAHVDAAQEGFIAAWRCLFPSPLHPVASAIHLVLHFPTPPSTSLPALWLLACSPLASTLCPSLPRGCTTFLYSMEGMLLPWAYQRNTFCELAISKSEVKKGYQVVQKKTPADTEHLTTTNSAPPTPTSMLMGQVECS